MKRIIAYLQAVGVMVRAVRKYGIDGALTRAESIGKQADFWNAEARRVYDEAIEALSSGNLVRYSRLYEQHASIRRRFQYEVVEPFAELQKP